MLFDEDILTINIGGGDISKHCTPHTVVEDGMSFKASKSKVMNLDCSSMFLFNQSMHRLTTETYISSFMRIEQNNMKQMMTAMAVPTADALITHPTHI